MLVIVEGGIAVATRDESVSVDFKGSGAACSLLMHARHSVLLCCICFRVAWLAEGALSTAKEEAWAMAMVCTRTKIEYHPPLRILRALNAVAANFVCGSGDGAGWWEALPAERWVADVRRSYSHHLGSSGIAPLHMPARGRSLTYRRRGMTFSRSVCMSCCAEYWYCAMVKEEFGLEELVGLR